MPSSAVSKAVQRRWLPGSESNDEVAVAALKFIQFVCKAVRLAQDDESEGEWRANQQTGIERVWDSMCGRSDGSGPAAGKLGTGVGVAKDLPTITDTSHHNFPWGSLAPPRQS